MSPHGCFYAITVQEGELSVTCVVVISAADAFAARRSGRGSPIVAFSGPFWLFPRAEPVATTFVESKLAVGDVGGSDSRCRSPAAEGTLWAVAVLFSRDWVVESREKNAEQLTRGEGFLCCCPELAVGDGGLLLLNFIDNSRMGSSVAALYYTGHRGSFGAVNWQWMVGFVCCCVVLYEYLISTE